MLRVLVACALVTGAAGAPRTKTKAAKAEAPTRSKLVVRNLDGDDLGLYFTGNFRDLPDMMGIESFVGIVPPGGAAGRYITFNDTFSLRSGDLKWRTSIGIFQHEQEEQPFKVTFANIMSFEDGEPIELQHHNQGFIWVDPGERVTHSSTPGHPFVIRDKANKPRFSVEIFEVGSDEL